jgi:IS5 family transposase
MNKVVPWKLLVALITPWYFSGERGRSPRGLETMLRMYLLPVWFNLADEAGAEALEENIYDSYAMRRFMGINFLEEDVPDATMPFKFWHLQEEHDEQKQILDKINEYLEERGVMARRGTIAGATIIEAPGSTKNSAKSRDPETRSAKKGRSGILD